MPAKTLCQACGRAQRSPNHICHPNSIRKVARRSAALAALDKKV